MSPVDIPWTNDRVVILQGTTARPTPEVRDWIWDNFGNEQYALSNNHLEERLRFTFLKREHALIFKLVWGGK